FHAMHARDIDERSELLLLLDRSLGAPCSVDIDLDVRVDVVAVDGFDVEDDAAAGLHRAPSGGADIFAARAAPGVRPVRRRIGRLRIAPFQLVSQTAVPIEAPVRSSQPGQRLRRPDRSRLCAASARVSFGSGPGAGAGRIAKNAMANSPETIAAALRTEHLLPRREGHLRREALFI